MEEPCFPKKELLPRVGILGARKARDEGSRGFARQRGMLAVAARVGRFGKDSIAGRVAGGRMVRAGRKGSSFRMVVSLATVDSEQAKSTGFIGR